MDADWLNFTVVSLRYPGFAIRAGIRISQEEARRVLRIEIVAAAILLPAFVPLADATMESLPDLIGIPLAVIWAAALGIIFYSLFPGFVLLFRAALRRFGIRMLCTGGVPLVLLYITRLLGFQ